MSELQSIPGKISAMYNDMDKAFKDNRLECKECDYRHDLQPGEAGRYIARGWPRHCGQTMRLVQPVAPSETDAICGASSAAGGE